MLLGSLAGFLADKVGRRPVIIGLLAFYELFTLLSIFTPSFVAFLLFRVLAGGIVPVLVAEISEFSSPRRRYRSNTILLIGTSVGGLVVAMLGLLMLPAIGLRGLWAIGGIFAIVLMPFAFALVPESAVFLRAHGREERAAVVSAKYGLESAEAGTQDEQKARIRDLFTPEYRLRTILVVLGGAFVLGFAAAFNTWFPQSLVQGGVQFSNALIFTAAFTIGAIVGPLVGGQLQDKGNPRIVVALYLFVSVVVLATTGSVLQAPIAVIVILVFLFGATAIPFLFNGLVANIFPVRLRGTILSLEFGVGRGAAVLFGGLGGTLAAAGLPASGNFFSWAMLPLVAAITVLLIPAYRREPKEPTAHPAVPTVTGRD
jgi:AAHS family benzoate transporter-like MFS transporter